MDHEEEAPPPYSAVDPLTRNAIASAEVNRVILRLRGGDVSLGDAASSDSSSSVVLASSPPTPANFTSATAYFVERPVPTIDNERPILEHHLTIYPRSQSKDFPRRPRCWGARTEHIIQQDWDMFLRYLFPPHLGLASSSDQLPPQVRAQIQRDRKDRPQETDEQRRMRISAVITEWNQYFFEPRATCITFSYITDAQNAPASPLCPRCYPAATRVSQENRTAVTVRPTPSLTPRQPMSPLSPPASNRHSPAPYAYPSPQHPPLPPTPHTPYGAPQYYHPPPPHHATYPYSPQPHIAYQHNASWNWNARPWPPPQQNSSSKSGPLGWISSLASQAQKYGDQISAQASHYGRQVEEHAMAHGRWIEEQASLQGRKMEDVFTGLVSRPRNEWPATDARGQVYYPNGYNYPYTPAINAVEPVKPIEPAATLPVQRIRRLSTGSASSDSSLESIDSLSTTSELSTSDLATVRAQLLSLEDHHDRDLHEAAVGLRRQLTVLQESRRRDRLAGRNWRQGWGQYPQQHGYGRGWGGRWESPQQHEQSAAEKRALKEETRATRKAFRDIEGPPPESSLEQQVQNLDLDHNRESQSTVQSFTSIPSPARSVAEISVISTPSTVSSHHLLEDEPPSSGKENQKQADTGKQSPKEAEKIKRKEVPGLEEKGKKSG
ncbi:hypothetical protein ANOM_002914 [Aspergillus nomiae NRRL 13137]|uniref:Uncharacterized protein n=1 Tax=Aspergillus nomiae NRRL (strain ATCC 15546 / NRRL 13137 / CBS 260.88 / M93) TaxID=1509407 RepID=A0A0L1J8P5_ASPN3|nr:uncharacterized protein ANOM_002914 [Aspergillus nomiae NRRL 13137]KNG88109.1 hypothetical protein ANOM_002914 [Aspergillus nomiae NRRL 13137]